MPVLKCFHLIFTSILDSSQIRQTKAFILYQSSFAIACWNSINFSQTEESGDLIYLGHWTTAVFGCLSYLKIKFISCPLLVVLIWGQDKYLEILKYWPVTHCYIKCCKGISTFQEKYCLCYLLCPRYLQFLWLKWA